MDIKGAGKRKSHKKGGAEKECEKKKKMNDKEASHYQKVTDILTHKKDLISFDGSSTSTCLSTEGAERTAKGQRTEIGSEGTVTEAAPKYIEGYIELESDVDSEEKCQEIPVVEKSAYADVTLTHAAFGKKKLHKKGGAEKQREKKKKIQEEEASHYQKCTDIFRPQKDLVSHEGDITATSFRSEAVEQTAEGQRTKTISDSTVNGAAPKCLEGYIEIESGEDSKEKCQEDPIVEKSAYADVTLIDPAEDQWFLRPTSENLNAFFKFHPCQPDGLRWNAKRLYRQKNGKPRQWLTYSHTSETFFCVVCLAFSKPTDRSAFIDGCSDERHMYQTIDEHEDSILHHSTSESFMMRSRNIAICSHHFKKHTHAKQEEVQRKRAILERVVETIKLIGKRGLSYRTTTETTYTFEDETLDHGNFWELLQYLKTFDPLLKSHLEDVIKKTNKHHEVAKSGKGRGNLVTLISKTTVNSLIDIISSLLKEGIAEEIREAEMFSIQLDTTQDINVVDQCSIIIRYVTDVVHERLVAVVDCTMTTGKALCELVCTALESMNISIANCVGNSTDGASNMQEQYNGFTAWLSKKAPDQIHVWCYAHVLNLVITDVTKISVSAVSLFGLLNSCVVFLRDSCLRMNVWRDKSIEARFRSISIIGETIWWAKDEALQKIFGLYNDPSKSVYVEVLLTMEEISTSDNFNDEIRYKAISFLKSLVTFDTILTAQMYLFIFQNTTPLSLYLQTQGIDVLQAYRMVTKTIDSIKQQGLDFSSIMDATNTFINWAKEKLDRCDSEILIQDDFPEVRVRRKKMIPGETATDEPIMSATDQYRIKVYNAAIDKVVTSLQSRFTTHGQLFADLACLDPRNFEDILQKFPQNALQRLSGLLTRFDPEASVEKLQHELLDFASKWSRLKLSIEEEYSMIQEVEDDTRYLNFEDEIVQHANVGQNKYKCKTCKDCIACCYSLLLRYNLYSKAYSSLFNAYKFALTLSSSQVACERSFSKHKNILNRLRNSPSQSRLEAFMLMSVEKDALMRISNENIIDLFASKSKLMQEMLTL
ncbi:uncharacterized protein LOC144821430 [Lissotriton helveticus]